MEPYQIVILIAVIIILGVAVLPAFNRWQFKRLPYDQQVLAIMRQAKDLFTGKIFHTAEQAAFSMLKTSERYLFSRG